MLKLFYSIPWYISCPLVVVLSITLAIGGLLLVRYFIGYQNLRHNNEVAGFTIAVVGLLYALQLGFAMVNVQGRYERLHQTIEDESNVLADLYRDAGIFPEDTLQAIRNDIEEYVQAVINQEWEEMVRGKHSLDAMYKVQSLWHRYYDFTPKTEKEKIWYSLSIERLNNLVNYRLQRLYFSKETLDPMMWTLLLGGAWVVIAFMYFFGLESLSAHILMTALLTGCITFILLIIIFFDNGFLGNEGITPHAFKRIQTSFDLWK